MVGYDQIFHEDTKEIGLRFNLVDFSEIMRRRLPTGVFKVH
jgi:hypothetical protein